jgi:hypothetical protein
MVIFGIVLLAFSFFLVYLICKFQIDYDESIPCAVFGALITLCFIAGIVIIDEHLYPSITPIDVYRGKTTLEITYRDGFAIDSTVVWKEEIK